MPRQTEFFIVVSDERGPAPQPYRHTTLEGARKEAARLAVLYKVRFFVMAVVAAVQPRSDVEWVEVSHAPSANFTKLSDLVKFANGDDGIPF